jgi:hypothetical protein
MSMVTVQVGEKKQQVTGRMELIILGLLDDQDRIASPEKVQVQFDCAGDSTVNMMITERRPLGVSGRRVLCS